MTLCACGCGIETNIYRGKYRKFVRYHHLKKYRNRPRTEEWKKKIGDGNRGKKHTTENNIKLSETNKGKHNSPETEFKKGIHYSQPTEFKKGQRKGILPKNKGRGKRIYYESKLNGKICFRSNYELVYAKYLDSKNIKWIYESTTFDLEDTTYTPDFFIPEEDLYVEIKGYMYEHAKNKISLFGKKFPNIGLKILYKEDLINLGLKELIK